MTTALIPHPTDYYGYVESELTDEGQAIRLAVAYVDGAYRAIERVFNPSGQYRGEVGWREMTVLHERYAPSYVEIRDFLIGEHNAPVVLAARVALRLTRRHACA